MKRTARPTVLRFGDLLSEAVAGLLSRPGRALLTALGVVLGVGTVVAVLGLTATASGQISQRFTALAATEVTLRPVPRADGTPAGDAFPADADRRAARITGVRAAGVYRTVRPETAGTISGVALPGAPGVRIPVVAATPGLLPALRPSLAGGRLFDAALDGKPVVVLGAGAARRLGVQRLDARPVVFLGGTPMSVVGIVEDVERRAEVLSAAIVPWRTATALWGAPGDADEPATMVVDTELGAAGVVAAQAGVAVRPDAPALFKVVAPPDPRTLRDGVTDDLSGLFLVLAVVCLVIGTAGIATTMLVAVLERVPEIGLRRALGARRRHIAAQFLTESAILGTLGGLAGTALGVLAVVGTALAKDWTAVLGSWSVLPAPLLGTVTGVLAGLYPAVRATRIEPVEAFRR